MPWNRAYLRYVEKRLQEIDPEITIPYWEWWKSPSIPRAFSQEDFGSEPNVLWDATRTSQEIAPASLRLPTSIAFPDFANLSARLNQEHSIVHASIGGNMASVSQAGLDPLNLVVMAAVDYRWYDWEQIHAVAPEEGLDVPLEPFTLTVRETLANFEP